jgi:hypothetical protein
MEFGTAQLGLGFSQIVPDNTPTPVGFDRGTYSHIVHGQRVRFVRSTWNNVWATLVVPADRVAQMTGRAMSQGAFTPAASDLLLRVAAQLCAEAQFAPSAEFAQAHLVAADALMERLAEAFVAPGLGDPLDVDAVSDCLRRCERVDGL